MTRICRPLAFLWLALLALLLILPATAADRDKRRLKLGRSADLGRVGIAIRPFEGMEKLPPPAPQTAVLTDAEGNRIEAVHRGSYWLYRQTVCLFSGPVCYLALYRPAYPPPDAVPTLRGDLLREADLRTWMESATAPDFTAPAARQTWLRTAFGPGNYTEGDDFVPFRRNDTARLFLLNRPPAPGTAWGLVLAAFPLDWEEPACLEALKALAKTIRFSPLAADTAAKPRRTPNAAAPAPERSAAYQDSRRRVIDSIRALKDWWYIETPHFIVVSNIARRKDVRDIAEEAEEIRTVYEKLMPPPREIDAVSVIRVFDDRDQYNAYLGGGAEWSGGCWMAHKQELVFFVAYEEVKDKKARSVIAKRTLRHELLHQYFFYALGHNTAPPWFNEGLAQYYEHLSLKSRARPAFHTEPDTENRALAAFAVSFWNAAQLRRMDYPEFQEFHDFTYNAVFAMMYYLMKGARLDAATAHYAQIPVRYFNTLGRTKDPEAADRAAWEGIDMERFDRDLRAFWKSRDRRKALNDDSLPPFPAD